MNEKGKEKVDEWEGEPEDQIGVKQLMDNEEFCNKVFTKDYAKEQLDYEKGYYLRNEHTNKHEYLAECVKQYNVGYPYLSTNTAVCIDKIYEEEEDTQLAIQQSIDEIDADVEQRKIQWNYELALNKTIPPEQHESPL